LPEKRDRLLSVNKPSPPTSLWFYQDSGICLHHFRYSAGRFDCLPHTHEEYNIIFCLSGGFETCVRDTRERVEPGDLLVINPGDLHFARYGSGGSESTGLTLHVTERALKEMMHRMHLPVDVEHSSVSFLGKVSFPVLYPLAHELLCELDQRQNGFEMVAESLVVKFVVHLLRHCLHPVVQSPQRILPRQLPSWQMIRALEYMNSRGKSGFSLIELCAKLGTSATRFIQLFKNSVGDGITPHLFYNHLIVSKAKRLLRAPSFSVKEVSYELGFQNESHFCRVFRGCTGLTPSGFRLSEPEPAETVLDSIDL
jgi:AraC-like DNA-binding protein